MTEAVETEQLEQWALVELMGHRRMAGRVALDERFGAPMLRVDVFVGPAPEAAVTTFNAPAALYCVTPISESMARRFSTQNVPQPISKWELPEALEPARDDDEIDAELGYPDDELQARR